MPIDWTQYKKVNGKVVTRRSKGRIYWQLADGKWKVQARRTRYRVLKSSDGRFVQISLSMIMALKEIMASDPRFPHVSEAFFERLGQVIDSPEFYQRFKKIHGEKMRK